jgi:hypothetical protein
VIANTQHYLAATWSAELIGLSFSVNPIDRHKVTVASVCLILFGNSSVIRAGCYYRSPSALLFYSDEKFEFQIKLPFDHNQSIENKKCLQLTLHIVNTFSKTLFFMVFISDD